MLQALDSSVWTKVTIGINVFLLWYTIRAIDCCLPVDLHAAFMGNSTGVLFADRYFAMVRGFSSATRVVPS